MTVLFSVIIPTKNRSVMLARALQSVAAQSDQDYEIIVIDDGSDPAEAGAIAALVGRTAKARLIRFDSSKGAPSARNRGIADARGSLIATLDSDDWWIAERLARHREVLADPATVMSYNRAFYVRGGDQDVCAIYGTAPDPVRPLSITLAGSNHVGGCSSVCFRSEAFHAAGGFDPDLPSCQDWDLWWRLAQRGAGGFIADPLTYQDIGPHERITTAPDKVLAGHEAVEARMVSPSFSAADLRFIAAHRHYVRAEIGVRFGNRTMVWSHLVKSLAARPTTLVLRRLPHLIRGGLGK